MMVRTCILRIRTFGKTSRSGLLILAAFLVQTAGVGTAQRVETAATADIVQNQPATDPAHSCFVENRGQVFDVYGKPRPDILYTADVGLATIYVRKTGISYQLRRLKPDPNAGSPGKGFPLWIRDHIYDVIRIDLEFLDCSRNSVVQTRSPRKDVSHFYLPHRPAGIRDVRSFETVIIENVYPSIDLRLQIKDGRFKSEFHVHPGADPRNIKLAYKGAHQCVTLGDGGLRVDAGIASLEESAPEAWEKGGKPVSVAYAVDSLVASFSTGSYDRSKTLVIDPWGQFYGAAVDDYLLAADSDAEGNAYASGATYRTDILAIAGKAVTVHANLDITLAKYSKDGALQWSLVYGGSAHDRVMNLCVDNTGNPIIAGSAESTDLPLKNAWQDERGKGWDFFLAKFSPDGALTWGTYFGGNNLDGPLYNAEWRCGLDAGPDGEVYICSGTQSTDLPTHKGYQQQFAGGFDIILARFSNDGRLAWATYFGGPMADAGRSCIVTPQNTIVVGGVSGGGLPLRAPLQDKHGGGGGDWAKDAVLAEFDLSGELIWSSYFGGDGTDDQPGLAVSGSGELYMYMPTTSSDLPLLQAVQDRNAGGYDGYLCRFSKLEGARKNRHLEYATFYGGSGDERTQGACPVVDSRNRILILGSTNSDDYPVIDAVQVKRAGGYDMFASIFSAELQPEYSTYIGGRAEDQALGAAIDPFDNVVLVGTSASHDFPLISTGRHSPAAERDGVIMRFGPQGPVISPPRAPSGVLGEVLSPTTVVLQWDDGHSNANSYIIEGRRDNGAWREVKRIPRDRHSDTLRDLTPATTYRFRVKAVNAKHESGYSNSVDLPLPIFPVPDSLRVDGQSITAITIRWEYEREYNAAFVLEHSSDGRTWQARDTLSLSARSYRIENCSPATTWHIRLRALEGNTYSDYSAIVTTSTLAFSPPTDLRADDITHEGMHLTWRDNSIGEKGFIVEIRTPGGIWTQVGTVKDNSSTYMIEGLLSSTTYECRVRGVAGRFESDPSNVVQARTLFFLEAPINMLIAFVLAAFVLGLIVFWRMHDRRRQSELRAEAAEYKEQAARAEAMQLQAEHERAQHEAQRAYTRRLLESQEIERKRIATELHDGVGQDILVIKNRALLGLQSEESAHTQLDGISTDASLVLEEMRRISRELRPAQLDRLGITAALEGMLEHIEEASELEIDADMENIDGGLEPSMEMNLFRIVQEGLNNIMKHAQATKLSLRLSRQNGGVLLTLSDNGRGFEVPTAADVTNHRTGMGLHGMQERADILGGSLNIDSTPGRGTRLSLEFPVSRSKSEDASESYGESATIKSMELQTGSVGQGKNSI